MKKRKQEECINRGRKKINGEETKIRTRIRGRRESREEEQHEGS